VKRLWVDANVVVRFLTGDPPEMAERSAKLMAKAETGEVVLVLSSLVVAEVIWVLKSFCRYPFADIAGVVIPLISADGVETEDREIMVEAIELALGKNVDFIDAVLALKAARQQESVCSFDEHFKRLPAHRVVPPPA
jgi:predicted nucleic acid-binding protein